MNETEVFVEKSNEEEISEKAALMMYASEYNYFINNNYYPIKEEDIVWPENVHNINNGPHNEDLDVSDFNYLLKELGADELSWNIPTLVIPYEEFFPTSFFPKSIIDNDLNIDNINNFTTLDVLQLLNTYDDYDIRRNVIISFVNLLNQTSKSADFCDQTYYEYLNSNAKLFDTHKSVLMNISKLLKKKSLAKQIFRICDTFGYINTWMRR